MYPLMREMFFSAASKRNRICFNIFCTEEFATAERNGSTEKHLKPANYDCRGGLDTALCVCSYAERGLQDSFCRWNSSQPCLTFFTFLFAQSVCFSSLALAK